MADIQNDITGLQPSSGCAVVVAHPDDEVLWASSLLASARKTIICYGDLSGKPVFSTGRRKAVAALPLNGVENLCLTEASMFNHSTWPNPEEIAEGLAPRRLPLGLHSAVLASYRRNFSELCRLLEQHLAGIDTVVTHNPWGEYGHEDHVQVFRAVEAVQKRLGFKIWVTGYVSDKAALLMQQHLHRLGPRSRALATDRPLAERCRDIYIQNGCWTWPDAFVWPEEEWFFPLRTDGATSAPVTPCAVQPVQMNFIRFYYTPPSRFAHSLKCAARHVFFRLVRAFPAFGAFAEKVRGR